MYIYPFFPDFVVALKEYISNDNFCSFYGTAALYILNMLIWIVRIECNRMK